MMIKAACAFGIAMLIARVLLPIDAAAETSIEVGTFVMAIDNSLGVGQAVTCRIVSDFNGRDFRTTVDIETLSSPKHRCAGT